MRTHKFESRILTLEEDLILGKKSTGIHSNLVFLSNLCNNYLSALLIYQVFGPRVAYIPQFEKCWYIDKIFDVNVKSLVYKQGLYYYLAYIPQIEMIL